MWLNTNKGDVKVTIYDAQGKEIITQTAGRAITEAWLDTCIQEVNLWDGIDSPYLYSLKAELVIDGEVVDEAATRFGVRDFT